MGKYTYRDWKKLKLKYKLKAKGIIRNNRIKVKKYNGNDFKK